MLPMAVLAEEAGVTTAQTAQSGTDAADGDTVDADTDDSDTADTGSSAPDDEDGGITLFAGHTGNHGFTLPEGETWQGITSLSSISGAGYYYLTKNVKVYAKKWEPKNGVVLDLNGYTLSSIYSGDFNNGVITIGKGVTFTLTDCNGSGNGKGIVTRDSGQNGRGVYVAGGGVFYMYGGTISGNSAKVGDPVYGGGVYVEGSTKNSGTVGTFHMYAGAISDNTAYNSKGNSGGAGVYVGEGAAFYLHDGSISGNRVLKSAGSSSGGGVYVGSKGTFVFEKGSVSYNYADNGGGIFVDTDGVFTMASGIIGGSAEDAANTAKFGGGVYTKGDCTMSGDAAVSSNKAISSGEITNKDGHGGGVYIESGTFVLSDNAKVSGNTAKYGGGVSFFTEDTSASFTMSDSAAVSGNTAVSYGGIAVLGGSFTMESGKVTLNKATEGSAGGVGVGNGGSFTMQGGIISGNQARSTNEPEGGGVMCGVYHGDYADTSKVDATGTFTMTGGAITGNNITGPDAKGGGVLLGPGSTMTVSGNVRIADNWRGGVLSGDVYEKGTDGTANNLWLDAYKDFDGVLQWACLTVAGQLSDTAAIGVGAKAATKTEPAIIAVGDGYVLTAADKAHFTSDSGNYRVKYDGGNSRMLLVSTEHVAHPICGASCADGTHAEEAYWHGVSDLSAINVPGNYYLTKDIELTSTWTPVYGVVLCLNGHSITSKAYNTIQVKANCSLTLTDCNRSGEGNGKLKHAVDPNNSAYFISGNAVYVVKDGTFVLYGGTITENEVLYNFNAGGAVYVSKGGTFRMHGGSITGNRIRFGLGGVVYVAGDFVMTGGEITGNQAVRTERAGANSYDKDLAFGGGVYVAQSGTMTVSGNVKIARNERIVIDNATNYNILSRATGNVYLADGRTITVGGALTGGDKSIGVTVANPPIDESTVTVAEGSGYTLTDTDAAAFAADAGSDYRVQQSDNTLELAVKIHKHYLCGGSTCNGAGGHTCEETIFTKWSDAANLPDSAGNWYLTTDVVISAAWEPQDGTVLDLNGHSIAVNGTATQGTNAITVKKGVRFTLTDCNGDDGVHRFTKYVQTTSTGLNGLFVPDDAGDIEVTGGVITRIGDRKLGRGVYVYGASSVFTMYGGTICGNYFTNGGAGMTIESGTVNMYGGEIRGNCVSVSAGAGVRIQEFGNFNMAGSAVIRENVSISTTDYGATYGGGGGVYVYGKFTMSEQAKIEHNRAERGDGGGVLVNSKGVFKMIGGDNYTVSIDNNYARDNGGGVYAASGSVTLRDNAKITSNSILNATSMMRGCGVFIANSATLSVSGAVQVTDNRDSYSIPANVLLNGTDNVNPITVIGALNGASIGVRVPGSVLDTIDDTHTVTIATAAAEGWIADGSFTGDNDEYPLRTSADGKTAQLCNHIHTWTYTTSAADTADGETAYTIAAACTKTGCTVSGGSVILSVQKVYTYDGNAKPVTVTDTLTTGDKVSAVTYTRKNGADPITLDGAPTDAGEYIARITVGEGAGAVAAEVTYKIDRLTPEASDFTFIPPTHLDYDGNEKHAAFDTTLPVTFDIRYSYAGSAGYIIPIGVGTYIAKVSVNYGSNWNSVTLTDPNWTFSILPVDYSVDIPAAWNEQHVIEGSSVFFALNNIGAFNVKWTGVNNEQRWNTLKWYTDSSCTTEVDRDTAFGTAGSTTLYWKFEFDNPDGNYIPGSKTGSIVITVVKGAAQNVRFRNHETEGTKTYGSAPFTLGAKNYTYEDGAIDDGTLTYTSSNPSVATIDVSTGVITLHSVGTTVITATAPMVPGRYTETSATYTLTVTPKELQGHDLEIISGGEKLYDGSDSADIVVAVESKYLAPGDTLIVSGSAKYSSADVWSSSTIIFTPDAITTGNYRLSSDPVTFYGVHILPVTITVTPDAGQHKTYGDADPVLTYTHTAAVNGEVPAFSGALARTEGEHAGSYAIKRGTLAFKDEGSFLAQNYTLELSTDAVNFTIDKATPTITAAASQKVIKNDLDTDISGWATFDNTDSDAKLVYTLEGVPAGITLTGSMLKAANAATTAGSFTIRVSAAATDNFNAPADVLITVTAVEKANAGVRITNAPSSKTYGDSVFTLTAAKTAPDGGTWSWTSSDADILEIVSGADTAAPTIAVKKADAAGAALTVVYTSATHYGTDTVTITVAAKTVTADMIADMPAATYTGSAILPAPAVKHGAATLVPGTDFDFGYADNTNAGTATLTVTGKGNYAGTAAKAFTILQKSFDGAVITLDHAAFPYSGAEQTVNITSVTLAGWTPVITAADYEIMDGSNKATDAADSITLTIRGKGNYTGTATTTWKIDRIDPAIADFDVTPVLPAAPVYDGNSKIVTVTPKSGIRGMGAVTVHYEATFGITYPKSETAPTDAGTYKVTASVAVGANYSAAELDLGTLTIGQAAGSTLTADKLSQKYSDLVLKTITPDYAGLPAGQKWTYTITDTAFTGSAAVDPASVTIGADTGVMTYRLTAGEKDDTVTWTVSVSCHNYTEFTKKVVLTLTKDQQAALRVTGDTTVVYGKTLQLGAEGGSGTGAVTYAVTGGTGDATIDGDGVLTPARVGTVKVTATRAGDVDFDPITSAEVEITITQATPTGEPKYTKITTGGRTLDDAKLTTVGSTLLPAEGALEWIDNAGNVLPGNTRVESGKTYKWRFTPTDSNYTSLTGEIRLYRNSGSGLPGSFTIQATAGENGSVTPAGKITVREGQTQVFTFTPNAGYTVDKVLVDGENVGVVTSYTFKYVTKDHTIEVVFAKSGETSGKFVDVPKSSYYEEAVNWAAENDIVSGVSSDRFDPDGPCTRAQAMTLLWRISGRPAPKSTVHSFTDVKPGSYYEQAVLWGVENGIIVGTSSTTFSPDAICTRAHAVALLYRAAGNPAVSGTARFSDVAPNAYYASAVAWAEMKGITTGIGGGLFGSDNHCTRAQIVTFLWRAMAK